MNDPVEFGVFDPEADFEIRHGHLPHWFQPNVAMFITFRTADSMPRPVLLRWEAELLTWLRTHSLEFESVPFIETQLPAEIRRKYYLYRTQRWDHHLDNAHGECWLSYRPIAEEVLKCVKFFDGERYDVDCVVVMPNHVHLIAQFYPPVEYRKQVKSWMQYSARIINQMLGQQGSFWQGEPFDHLIRNSDEFVRFQRYIQENGRRAGLREGEYLYWSR